MPITYRLAIIRFGPPVRFCSAAVVLFVCLCLSIAPKAEAQKLKAQLAWHSFEDALSIADSTDRPLLVDVWAPWCGWCHKMKNEVYPALHSDLSGHFVLSRLNLDDHDLKYSYRGVKFSPFRLIRKFKVRSVPSILFLSPEGDYVAHVSGYRNAEDMRLVLEHIRQALLQTSSSVQ